MQGVLGSGLLQYIRGLSLTTVITYNSAKSGSLPALLGQKWMFLVRGTYHIHKSWFPQSITHLMYFLMVNVLARNR